MTGTSEKGEEKKEEIKSVDYYLTQYDMDQPFPFPIKITPAAGRWVNKLAVRDIRLRELEFNSRRELKNKVRAYRFRKFNIKLMIMGAMAGLFFATAKNVADDIDNFGE